MTILPVDTTFDERKNHYNTTQPGKDLRKTIVKYNNALVGFCRTHHVGGLVDKTTSNVARVFAETVAIYAKFVAKDVEELGILLYNATSAMLRNPEHTNLITVFDILKIYVKNYPTASLVQKMEERLAGLRAVAE
jgi:hypothetical protein